jgi:hypothetical protein
MNNKRMSMAAALVAAALSLSACGGSGGKTADAATSDAPSASASAPATSGDTYTPLTKADFASTIAEASKSKGSAHMRMTLGTSVKASGDVNYGGGTPSMKMAMDISQGGKRMRIQEILVDGVIYMSMPGVTPQGKYLKLDSNTPGMGSFGDVLKNIDPASMVAQMTKSLKRLEYVGPAMIDGDQTRQYKLVVDAKKAVQSLGLSGLPSSAASAIPDAMTYDAYFNADNTLRRITMKVMNEAMQVDMTNWGAPVQVVAPPRSDVVDMSKMAPSMPAKP